MHLLNFWIHECKYNSSKRLCSMQNNCECFSKTWNWYDSKLALKSNQNEMGQSNDCFAKGFVYVFVFVWFQLKVKYRKLLMKWTNVFLIDIIFLFVLSSERLWTIVDFFLSKGFQWSIFICWLDISNIVCWWQRMNISFELKQLCNYENDIARGQR